MIRSRRKNPRPGRLQGVELEILRLACWERDGGKCQSCRISTSYDAPHTWPNSYHMAHIKAKRMGGDSLDNVRTLCGSCHRDSHNFGPSMVKPVKRKL